MVYGREIEGQVTTFGTTGYTRHDVFLLYDRLTGTVWYPLTNEAFDGIGGELLGSSIPILDKPPIMTLDEWRQMHPHTLVLLGDKSQVDDVDDRTAEDALP